MQKQWTSLSLTEYVQIQGDRRYKVLIIMSGEMSRGKVITGTISLGHEEFISIGYDLRTSVELLKQLLTVYGEEDSPYHFYYEYETDEQLDDILDIHRLSLDVI